MLPLLNTCANGQEWSMSAAREPVADHFDLSEEDRKELLPSGTQPRFNNRFAWAKIYLERAGLLTRTRRGHFTISPVGENVLKNSPGHIDISFLNQFEEFDNFRTKSSEKEFSPTVTTTSETPEEQLQDAHKRLCGDLASELLMQIADMSSEFFEKLVLDLLLAMGYGGFNEQAGTLTNSGADAGIDGIINQDHLGLETIYLQAKKWKDTVGRPEIHKFVGALHGRRARKGVFLTTSSFSRDALKYAGTIETKVVLIDGQRLAELMIEHNVACTPNQTFVVKKIDSDYFCED